MDVETGAPQREYQPRSSRKLTAAQQAILEEHLEEQFRNLDRDYNKRTDPNSAIPTVDILLSKRLTSLLSLILAIPPIPPTQHLQVAFLLRFTSAAREWIAGYPLQWPDWYTANSNTGAAFAPEEQAQNTITLLLEFLRKLDAGWRRVLLPQISTEMPVNTSATSPAPSLTATEKIRLRSCVMSIRQTLLRWLARYRKQNGASKSSARLQSGPIEQPSLEPSDVSDTGTSPGIVEAATEEPSLGETSRAIVAEEEPLGDWEVAIANSMSRTLELVI
ncbi:hypothetical protein NCC49_001139 [Naganishia albida]|nr:hypothetical protein NCC49_001139 [Naganishia albida]